jgi:hypothetical protein
MIKFRILKYIHVISNIVVQIMAIFQIYPQLRLFFARYAPFFKT